MAIVKVQHVCHVSDIYVTYPTLRVGIGYSVSESDIMSRIGHSVSDLILRVEIRHKCHVSYNMCPISDKIHENVRY